MTSHVFVIQLLVGFLICITNAHVGVVIGGLGGSNTIEIVTPNGVCLGTESDPKLPLAPGGSIDGWVAEYVDNRIVLCGGQYGGESNKCYTLEIGSKQWDGPCLMQHSRVDAFSAALQGKGQMLVMGGYNTEEQWLDTVELGQCAFEEQQSWKMNRAIYGACSIAVGNKVYVIGGNKKNNIGNNNIDNVEVLDLKTNSWTPLSPLPKPREASSCAAYTLDGDEGILVAGGCNNDCRDHSSDTFFYSFSSETWKTLRAKLVERRSTGKMLIIDGKPTIPGGISDKGTLKTIEEFDGKNWSLREQTLTFQRGSAATPSSIPEDAIKCP